MLKGRNSIIFILLLACLVVFGSILPPTTETINITTALPIEPGVIYEGSIGTGMGTGTGQFINQTDVEFSEVTNLIYVSDQVNGRVQIFDSNGTFNKSIGYSGTQPGNFSYPRGITLNSTNLFVADSGNSRVQIFDLYGNYKASVGTYGTGNGQFIGPTDVAVNDTHIFVVDTKNDRIEIFDSNLNFKQEIGGGIFSGPQGIAVNSTNIVVTDTGNSRIVVLDLAGNVKSTISNSAYVSVDQPIDVELTWDGWIVFADFNPNVVIFYPPTFSDGSLAFSFGGTELAGVYGVGLNQTHIFATDMNNGLIRMYRYFYSPVSTSPASSTPATSTDGGAGTTTATETTTVTVTPPCTCSTGTGENGTETTTVIFFILSNTTETTTITSIDKSLLPFTTGFAILGLITAVIYSKRKKMSKTE